MRYAEASDARREKGEVLGALDGIPFSIKDNFCVKGVRTTCSSKMLESFVPPYTSTVAERLEGQGAVLIGKNNMDEFAMGSANLNSYFGSAVNPWGEEDRVAGGTSGGSAVAVAVGAGVFSIGSDTGGSVRMPAAYCGVVGYKPSYGVLSRHGLISYASSLDCPAPVTRTVEDATTLLRTLSGVDEKDSTSTELRRSERCIDFHSASPLAGVKVGVPAEYWVEEMSDDVIRAWKDGLDTMEKQGATIVEVSLQHTRAALAAYYVLAPAEASSNLSRYDGVRYGHRSVEEGGEGGEEVKEETNAAQDLHRMYTNTRTEGFGAEVKRRIMLGTYVLGTSSFKAYFEKAQKIRRMVVDDFDAAFRRVDVLLVPSTPTAAYTIRSATDMNTVTDTYANDVMTIPASLAGLPAVSVPQCLSSSSLPLGLTVIGQRLDDLFTLDVAAVLEQGRGMTAADFVPALPSLR
uniref:Glutamyl-tRNA(Gln) amidotransferase subunit A, mitochondrial n=1 Tax=Palpitomonas bilix TaxID=652834 RepID=A0A7S3GLD7_9EUKA